MPLTRFCAHYGLDSRMVRTRGTNEWHHVGKYAVKVDYYDWRDFLGKWERFSKKRPRPDQLARRIEVDRRREVEKDFALVE